jgi:hypothetical protein
VVFLAEELKKQFTQLKRRIDNLFLRKRERLNRQVRTTGEIIIFFGKGLSIDWRNEESENGFSVVWERE